jgi:hypothetical protein
LFSTKIFDKNRKFFFIFASFFQVLAIAEYNDSAEEPALDSYFKQIFSEDEIFKVTEPTEEERARFYEPVFEAALAMPIREAEPLHEVTIDELEVVPLPESRELTENEEKRLRKKEDALLRELRIFLRYEMLTSNQ